LRGIPNSLSDPLYELGDFENMLLLLSISCAILATFWPIFLSLVGVEFNLEKSAFLVFFEGSYIKFFIYPAVWRHVLSK